MNLDKFNTHRDGFNELDFRACFSFKTQNSIAFTVERYSKSLLPVRQLGWIDVHYPCVGHIKVQVRICLPPEYHEFAQLKSLLNAVFTQLDLPLDETYELVAFKGSDRLHMIQPVDRDGLTIGTY